MPSAATRDRVNPENRIVVYVPAQSLRVNKNVIKILSVSDLILQMGSPVEMMLVVFIHQTPRELIQAVM